MQSGSMISPNPRLALSPALPQKSLANREQLLRRRASVPLTQKHTGCIQTRTNVLVISLLRCLAASLCHRDE